MSELPKIGAVLRYVIGAAGYRSVFNTESKAKDLDDLATERRLSAQTRLLLAVETSIENALMHECGAQWTKLFCNEWQGVKTLLRHFAQELPVCFLMQVNMEQILSQKVTIPLVAGLLDNCFELDSSLDRKQWESRPFNAWVEMASSKFDLPEQSILDNIANHIDVDPKTTNERWFKHGTPIQEIKWPIRPVVEAAVAASTVETDDAQIKHLTGWLIVAVALQSCSEPFRRNVGSNSIENELPVDATDLLNREEVLNLQNSLCLLDELLESQGNLGRIKKLLAEFKKTIANSSADTMFLYHWYAAKYGAARQDQPGAIKHYKDAVKGAWWRGGEYQETILKEALLYAVGTGDKVAADRYWDQIHMLGLIKEPKQPLDEQKLRQLTYSFMNKFPELSSKQQVGPPIDVQLRDTGFTITSKHIKNPNQKTKHNQGTVIRTPLMDAIRDGTLDDVVLFIDDHPKRTKDKNGNPNDFVKGSGSGPLMEAMWRAQNRKQPEIMNYLLTLNLSSETVNRVVSTRRETPLSVAIEMGDAETISRLIDLGASIDAPCGDANCALTLAVMLVAYSLMSMEHFMGLASGGSAIIDVIDAKAGVVTDEELLAHHLSQVNLIEGNSRNYAIAKEARTHMLPSAEPLLRVIEVLLQAGADPNKPYRSQQEPQYEWTPTLLAAQIGHLELFRLLAENPNTPGDPALTLEPALSAHAEKNALWIAVSHDCKAIVQYIQD